VDHLDKELTTTVIWAVKTVLILKNKKPQLEITVILEPIKECAEIVIVVTGVAAAVVTARNPFAAFQDISTRCPKFRRTERICTKYPLDEEKNQISAHPTRQTDVAGLKSLERKTILK
jgi:hypothetical protein